MGLDAVELVLEVEETFAIKIPDEEAAGILTVGNLFDYVVAKIDISTNNAVCLSAATFYSLRRAAKTLGLKDRLRPRDATAMMLPALNRRAFWDRLRRESGLKLPALCRPGWLVLLLSIITAGIAIALGNVALLALDSSILAIATAVLACFVVGGVAALTTRPLAVLPSSACKTLKGLAERTMAMNLPLLAQRYGGAHANDVWVTLQGIIVEQLAVPPEKVTRDARFVNDLGCD